MLQKEELASITSSSDTSDPSQEQTQLKLQQKDEEIKLYRTKYEECSKQLASMVIKSLLHFILSFLPFTPVKMWRISNLQSAIKLSFQIQKSVVLFALLQASSGSGSGSTENVADLLEQHNQQSEKTSQLESQLTLALADNAKLQEEKNNLDEKVKALTVENSSLEIKCKVILLLV